MNESKKSRDIPNDVTVTSQNGIFLRFLILLLKMTCFLVVFSSVSIERGCGQVLYFVSV